LILIDWSPISKMRERNMSGISDESGIQLADHITQLFESGNVKFNHVYWETNNVANFT
jgi:hypothetical protein